ncbi:MAG: hypothetical protein ACXVA9_12890, partial [Bdellovibrionales bacterium]
MRRTLLAFFGMIFVGYWLWTADSPHDGQAALNPVLPGLVRFLPSASQKLFPSNVSDAKSPADLTGIRHWLVEEAVKVGRVDSNPSSTVLRLKQKALSMKTSELKILRDTALSPTASGDERFLAVYIIGLAESAAARDFLKEIASAPVPATANDRNYSDEVVIRANALESVVHRLSNSESIKYLQDVLAHTSDPSLARHARYWL